MQPVGSGLDDLTLGPQRQGGGGTDLDALATAGAGRGLTPGLAHVRLYAGLEAAVHDVPGVCALDLVADPYAAQAQDAAVVIDEDVRVRCVHVAPRKLELEARRRHAVPVAERLQLARASLPPDLPPPTLAPVTSIMGEIMYLAVTSDRHTPMELKTAADWVVRRRLLAVPGVRSVNKYGYLDREIKVEISNDALERYQVSPHEIVNAIHNRNIRATGGSFESYTSEKNIVTLAEFTDPMEAGDVIVRLTGGSSTVRVKDVALLRDDVESAKGLLRMNGTPAISLR